MKRGNFNICSCMNAFPGEGIDSRIEIFTKRLPLLRSLVKGADSAPFAAGIWLDSKSASYLAKNRQSKEFADFVKSLGFYSFTANAFPYAKFHAAPVKTTVYTPDWTEQDRLDYTNAVADTLVHLMPECSEGSISTLPGSYKASFNHKNIRELQRNILLAATHLRHLKIKTGRHIRLAFEMEPDCLWESPAEFIEFYDKYLRDDDISEFIGACFDTCHQELLGSKPGAGIAMFLEHGVKIAKIQLSSAIKASDAASKKTLEKDFLDSVYLHQTRAFPNGADIIKWPDLPDALKSREREMPWVTHFHIPVFMEDMQGGLEPANAELKATLEIVRKDSSVCPYLEIETYSYNVLPEHMKSRSMEHSMAAEVDFVLEKLGVH